MNAKIKNIICELLELEKEMDSMYEDGNVDVVFHKGSVIEARQRLEQVLNQIKKEVSHV